MQIITSTVQEPAAQALSFETPLENALYIDIETTGLSAQQDRIWMIGCACFQGDSWHITQWFDDTGNSEKDLLVSFLAYANPFGAFVHYNGDRFDIPFLTRRIEAYRIENTTINKRSIDLYKYVKPFRKLLALPSYRLSSVVEFFGKTEAATPSGKDLIALYSSFLGNHLPETVRTLSAHNVSDLAALLRISPVVLLRRIFGAELTAESARANRYHDAEGVFRQEVIISCVPSRDMLAEQEDLPAGDETLIQRDADASRCSSSLWVRPVTASADGCYFTTDGTHVTIKVPLYCQEMKYFYANYKDYYYLPGQDLAMHKSIASFVDSSRREQAKAENCYTRKTSSFLPEWDAFRAPFFKKSYKDSGIFFEFTQEMKKDKDFFSAYATYIYRHIVQA
ncbi:MAG: ribonuclease H-like domain-containing protein [Firmicutes bacterium]|nr:ribonuclease H-like domain-containing protein [Bacillota bacterium]